MQCHPDSSRSSSVAPLPVATPVKVDNAMPQASMGQLFAAIDSADISSVAIQLANGQLDLTRTNTEGQTPLHRAIARGNPRTAVMLIDHLQPHELDATDRHGETPLMTATVKGALVVMETLIQAGANIHTTAPDNATALMRAAAVNETKAALLLLSHGANVNHVDDRERSALMDAAEAGYLNTVTLLLNFAADMEIVDLVGDTAMRLAERGHHYAVINALHDAASFLRVDDDPLSTKGYVAA